MSNDFKRTLHLFLKWNFWYAWKIVFHSPFMGWNECRESVSEKEEQ